MYFQIFKQKNFSKISKNEMERKMREKVSLDEEDDHILEGDGKNAKQS